MSMFAVGGLSGWALGPILTTPVVGLLGLRGTAIVALVPLAATLLLLPSTCATSRASGRRSRPAHVARETLAPSDWPGFTVAATAGTLRTGALFGFQAFVPLYVWRTLDSSEGVGNTAIAAMLAAGALGTLLGGRLSDLHGFRRVVVFSLVRLRAAGAARPGRAAARAVPADRAASGSSREMNFYPIVVLAQRALPRHVGFASGVTLGLSIGIGSLASPLLGVLADHTSLRTALVGAGLAGGARGARLARAAARSRHERRLRRRARGGRGEDGALVFESGEPARAGGLHAVSGRPRPARAVGADRRRHLGPLRPPGRRLGGRAARRARVRLAPARRAASRSRSRCPCWRRCASGASARALYIYPTKALAQDQARALRDYGLGLRPAVYDGDTPREQRHLVRRFANPILTNPDMLHVGILPNHRRWADVLSNLTHVVIDEAHTYRGVFGSHVALVLRRLRRVCALYGCEPQFLLASATIANPAEACAALTGLDVRVVDRDGAPRAPRRVAFWDTPLLDEAEGTRGSALGEAAGLLAALTARGLRTICFVKSRKASELVFRFARESLVSAGRDDVAERLAPYRAGYTAEERRRIEGDLVSGRLLGVVATEALELGVDVGLLDCALAIGFPGTVASLRQQWGRAGRRGEGLALLVPGADALDRYFINHPDALLGRANEAAILDPTNPEIRIGHLRAAAHELPLTAVRRRRARRRRAERRRAARRGRRARAHARRASPGAARARPPGRSRCARARPTRSPSSSGATGTLLGMLEQERAFSTVHEGAVYLHRGETYLAETLDLADRVALVAPFDGPWYTQPRRETETSIVRALSRPEQLLRRGAQLRRGRGERPGRRVRAPQPARADAGSTRSRSTCRRGSSRRARSGSCRPTS